MKRLLVVPGLLVFSLALTACAPMAPAPAAPAAATAVETEAPAEAATDMATEAPAVVDIVDTAVAAGNFQTLAAAVGAAGLVDTLKGEGPFTVFAPTDEAFAALPAGTLEELLADPTGQLSQILLYHVVPGKVVAADVADGLEVETAQGGKVKFTIVDGAPMINDAKIVATDVMASNGVIHVIDKVILPPADEAAATEAAPAEAAAPAGNIAEVAAAAGNFTTLLTAVEAAGLVEALSGEGPFTVFAPTDEAFAKLSEDQLNALLADPANLLKPILLYHVVPGKVMAADLADGLEVETLDGAKVKFTLADGKALINDANIVATDIAATNGVIHVIDAVILPPQ